MPPSSHARSARRSALHCALALLSLLVACQTTPPPPEPKKSGGDAGLRSAERECANGRAASCERAGMRYLKGMGSRPNLDRAAEYLERACKELPRACVELGTTRVMQGNDDAGRALYKQGCDAGSSEGCYALAELERAQDPKRAARLFEQSCTSKVIGACYSLGAMLARGDGVPADLTRAAQLFEKACASGDGRACFALAFQLQRGSGVAADRTRANELFGEARDFFKELCSGGEGYACHNLALIYAGGLGTRAEPERAAVLLERACTLGSKRSCGISPEALGSSPDPL